MRLLIALVLIAATLRTASAEKLTVLLDWFVNPGHAPLVVAQAIGAYAEEGLEVELVPPGDATMPPKLVAAGHGDLAITSQPQFHQQLDQGLPLKRVGVLIDHPLSSLAAIEGSGVRVIADLKGRRLGYGAGDIELAELEIILNTAGLTSRDVTLVNVGEQLSTSLLTRQVDAVTVYRNYEPFELREKGATPVLFDYEANGVPTFDEMILVAQGSSAADPRFGRFLRAVAKGAAFVKLHPDEAWRKFTALYPDLNNPLNRASWDASRPLFAADPFAFDRARYVGFSAFLAKAGLISGTPDPTVYATIPAGGS